MEKELKVLNELQNTYGKIVEISRNLGYNACDEETKSEKIIDAILYCISAINSRLKFIDEEVQRLK